MLLACVSAFISLAFITQGLVGHPPPLLPAKTLDGKTVDEGYYKGHVTIVSAMYIGCLPCMYEISTLNRIKRDYAGDNRVQILCMARQMRSQMVDFNSDEKNLMNSIRKAIGAERIEYDIQPACEDAPSKMEQKVTGDSDVYINIKSECSIIEEQFGIRSYPTILFIDKKGVVRNVHTGGPGKNNDTTFYDKIKKEVDELLAEQ